MSKIARYAGNLRAFGSNAQGLERTLFGETAQADDLTSQITAAFLRGWGVVGPAENPSLEDFNAAMYTMSQFIAYQHQMGVPEWDAAQEYYVGSLCVRAGETYASLANSNINSAPPSAKWTQVITVKNGLASLGIADENGFVGRMIGPPKILTATGVFTKSPGAKHVRVRGVGGGGAGGGVGATSSGSVRAGGGGASGTYGEIWIPNVPDAVPYTIGSAGNGVLGGDGGNGGSSTFGSYLTLPGGGGGQLGITVTGPARTAGGGSAAGVAVGASYSVQGQRGSDAFAVSNATVMAGSGSGNPLGTGASLFIASTSASVSSQGVSGSGSGSGGGGAVSGNGGTAQAGGAATAGAFIVEEYA